MSGKVLKDYDLSKYRSITINYDKAIFNEIQECIEEDKEGAHKIKEVIVKRRNKKIDGGKIFSIIASLAIVAALGVGIVSIVKTATSDKDKNYIDLNVADNATSKLFKIAAAFCA